MKSIIAPLIISIPISDKCGLISIASVEILFPANNTPFNFSAKIFPITTADTDETGYVNGSYGADAQYLGTSFNGKKVHFKISGVQAWTDINNVELYLYNDSHILSTYYVYNHSLIHTISDRKSVV